MFSGWCRVTGNSYRRKRQRQRRRQRQRLGLQVQQVRFQVKGVKLLISTEATSAVLSDVASPLTLTGPLKTTWRRRRRTAFKKTKNPTSEAKDEDENGKIKDEKVKILEVKMIEAFF